MIFSKNKNAHSNDDTQSLIKALNAVQAIIWFENDGTIKDANQNFLDAVGYTKEEVVGKHHRMFVSETYAQSDRYKEFWAKLGSGETNQGEFKRRNKEGHEMWLEASYNPTFGRDGKQTGVVKFAIDVTERKLRNSDYKGQLAAISRSQAVIEFDLTGTILTANDNFCDAMGYSLAEIQGKKHLMFVEPAYGASAEYKNFWKTLGKGEFKSAEFLRIGKGGREIWIQATYNPILNASGEPYKVVKFATDITERKQLVGALEENLKHLASGDLTPRMNIESGSEFADLCSAFNETMERLTTLVADIQAASGEMSSGTRTIAQGAKDLSNRTEEQAAALQETNAAVEDISSNITATASSAKNANVAAQEAEKRAVQGDSVVRSAISAMERIEDGSKKITEIISVIESISFQTNLLALNAAVEAARAGESGKGFAVVASEVRTLAQRSSEAANDITDLIQTSTSQVVEGADLVRSTGDVLLEIKTSIDQVVENVNEISQASMEQANGIKAISSVVSGIDANTQSNAQMAQLSSTNAENLAKESDRLSELASYFQAEKSPAITSSHAISNIKKSA